MKFPIFWVINRTNKKPTAYFQRLAGFNKIPRVKSLQLSEYFSQGFADPDVLQIRYTVIHPLVIPQGAADAKFVEG